MRFEDADAIAIQTVGQLDHRAFVRKSVNNGLEAFDVLLSHYATGYTFSRNYSRAMVAKVTHAGVGVSAGKGTSGWRVAVRSWSKEDWLAPEFEKIRQLPAEELDVQITGPLVPLKAQGPALNVQRCRPLRAGFSIGHHQVTAGTLGTFVRRQADNQLLLLSNNHILMDHNSRSNNDAILQPGLADGGLMPDSKVGVLDQFVRLKRIGNVVDAAVATIEDGATPDDLAIPGIGLVSSASSMSPRDLAQEKTRVRKVGRTTGLTTGSVNAIVRNLSLQYDDGDRYFASAIEITWDKERFSGKGDSGSLVVHGTENVAIGLLFGGDDDDQYSYMNPVAEVLDLLHTRF